MANLDQDSGLKQDEKHDLATYTNISIPPPLPGRLGIG